MYISTYLSDSWVGLLRYIHYINLIVLVHVILSICKWWTNIPSDNLASTAEIAQVFLPCTNDDNPVD